MSDQLAGQLQALYTELHDELRFFYRHNLHTVCKSLQISNSLLRMMVTTHPTLALRALLNDTYLIASSCHRVVEAWSCSPLKKGEFEVQAQTTECTREIPASFRFRNQTYIGYLDPVTLVMSHFGTPVDCALQRFTPLVIYQRLCL